MFDGISCAMVALDRAGIHVDNYYASEIDKHAIAVSKDNWKDIIHIGDVTKVSFADGILYTELGNHFAGKIDLVLAGSPCQGFSMAGKQLAFDDPRSSLYFEFERILAEVRQYNPECLFLLENVKMKQESKDVITSRLGVEPVAINSNLVSAQNRYRLYWTNINGVTQPADKGIYLQDILEPIVDEKYFIKAGRLSWLQTFGEVKVKDGYIAFNPTKAKCLTVRGEPSWNTTYIVQPVREIGRRLTADGVRADHDKSIPITRRLEVGTSHQSNCITTVQKDSLIIQWPHGANSGGYRAIDGKTPALTTSSWEANNLLLTEGMVRKLTPIENERLQTLPDNYTKAISDSQRYKSIGNGWTVDVIAHILKGIQ